MIGLNLTLVSALAAAAASAFATWQLTSTVYGARIDSIRAEHAQQTVDANRQAFRAAEQYEARRAALAPRAAAQQKRTNDALEANRSWADQRIPDSVREQLDAAAALDDPAEPDGHVPAGPAPEDRDER